MTPNPKNIGAAPEEYPIRARVKPEGFQYYWPSMRAMVGGIHDFKRHESGSYYCRNGWAWAPTSLEIISDAAGVPEPSLAKGNPPYQVEEMDLGPDPLAKGPSPSEVTQPGEGVDLGPTPAELGLGLDAVAAWILDRLGPDREANEKFLEAQLSELQIFSIELGRKQARATLRRESK